MLLKKYFFSYEHFKEANVVNGPLMDKDYFVSCVNWGRLSGRKRWVGGEVLARLAGARQKFPPGKEKKKNELHERLLNHPYLRTKKHKVTSG